VRRILMRRVVCLLAAVALITGWLIPTGPADAQTLANGRTVSGDFKGAGYDQVATLYDVNDDLGLRIVVLDPTPDGKFTSSEWFLAGANRFDLGRMKVAAADLNRDGKMDLAALYNDGNLTVHIVVWLSTGASFNYQGNAGWFRHTNFDWNRARDFLAGTFDGTPKTGLVIPYVLDNFRLKMLYLVSTGTGLFYTGDDGAYDSGDGQIDATKARFIAGHFTRSDGIDQVAMLYQYPNNRIGVHVFDPSIRGLQPIGGWAGRWISPLNFLDLTWAKLATTDADGDRRSDIVLYYRYADGTSRVHYMFAANNFALVDTSGVQVFAAGVVPWGATNIVGGTFTPGGAGTFATLTDTGTGATQAGRLNGTLTTRLFDGAAWMTPASEMTLVGCRSCWPLNGAPIAAGQPNVHRRPLAVKIDNAPTARPHYGISQADMVWELLVEGFITRLAAYFHSQDPSTIGAVRSVRFSDRYTTPMVRGSLVFSGASQLMEGLVRGDIAAGYYVGVSPQIGQGNAFYRTGVDGRVAPHNLFTSSDALRQATNDVGGGGAVDVPAWSFLQSPVHPATIGGFIGSVGASSLTIPYRADARVRYEYDAASHTYARYQSSSNALTFQREVDGNNNVAIAARNVVIIYTDVIVTDVVDDAGGAPSLDMRMVGTGPATVFRDGLRQDGTWSRATNFDPFVFTNFYGHRIYLSPGQTWVHVVPIDWQIFSQ
jgi:hypothetical protein